jgi:vancomycin permeability regulator SanA
MKKKTLFVACATVLAGVATYFIRKKIISQRKEVSEPSSVPSRHVTDVFAKAKANSNKNNEP